MISFVSITNKHYAHIKSTFIKRDLSIFPRFSSLFLPYYNLLNYIFIYNIMFANYLDTRHILYIKYKTYVL